MVSDRWKEPLCQIQLDPFSLFDSLHTLQTDERRWVLHWRAIYTIRYFVCVTVDVQRY